MIVAVMVVLAIVAVMVVPAIVAVRAIVVVDDRIMGKGEGVEILLEVPVCDMEGKEVGVVSLPERVFAISPHRSVLHDVVVQQLAALRRGTHAVKNRAAVRGGGRKPWRQKKTGRARHSSIRSPLWVGGGVTFGPQPRCYNYRINRKVRRLAIRSALSARAKEGNLSVVQGLSLAEPKTRAMVHVLKNLQMMDKRNQLTKARLLVVTEQKPGENELRAARNIPGVRVVSAANLNALDIVRHEQMILTRDAVKVVDEVFGT